MIRNAFYYYHKLFSQPSRQESYAVVKTWRLLGLVRQKSKAKIVGTPEKAEVNDRGRRILTKWLGMEGSNLRFLSQSQASYHWTNPQGNCAQAQFQTTPCAGLASPEL